MKSVLIWLKNNPITVASGLVILLALGFAAWTWSSFGALRGDLEATAREKGKLENFGNNTAELPAEEIDAQPLTVEGVTYNPPTVDRMRRIFGDLNSQTELTAATFAVFNERGHQQLVEGFFPSAAGDAFNYKNRYRDAIQTLLAGPGPAAGFAEQNGVLLPTLKAGLPPQAQTLQTRLNRIAEEGARAFGDRLTEDQIRRLEDEQRVELLEALTERARALDVYAINDIGPTTALNPEYPLPVLRYVYEGSQPEPRQMWESQMQTWILQDLIASIGLANGVPVPGVAPLPAAARGEGGSAQGVLGAVVKRLISADVLPGYVGIQSSGGVGQLDSDTNTGRNASAGLAAGAGPVEGLASDGAGIPVIKPNYFVSPTGRTSNPVFDVRHTRLRVHADYTRLPLLFEAMAKINFISVVDMKLASIDEYDYSTSGRLGGPFVYGVGEIVDVEMIVESLWFRSWTVPLMPDSVKTTLGIATVEPAVADDTF
ncbi:hypothetical protein [Phycisphaera mikurensis]|uniref:Uncharacterized protein n=1 Tax=Phycisphaera mikurensis (strain NBRC 102666 / KCTC 22515 / FYK2301M01) TaxID=1142394 RepID=I0IFS8_PHYMF|nr:hypothetical protein [Phycisphaera mikurensis]MBB6440494.1 hypothetical protein [Phycisphaera mikurensis]BAM04116.1 hypothetical protein PSMK_19570 [Phycisphaera mikurensis NBRC 102666]